MKATENISEKILNELNSNNPHLYFKVKNIEDHIINIRVSDHSMNEKNNNDLTLSFITQLTHSKNGQQRSNYEWCMNKEGFDERNYMTIEDILKEYEIIDIIN